VLLEVAGEGILGIEIYQVHRAVELAQQANEEVKELPRRAAAYGEVDIGAGSDADVGLASDGVLAEVAGRRDGVDRQVRVG